MRILVTGDRRWVCTELAERVLNRLLVLWSRPGDHSRWSAGVDNAFAVACRKLTIKAEWHLADWKGLGNIAGPASHFEKRLEPDLDSSRPACFDATHDTFVADGEGGKTPLAIKTFLARTNDMQENG